MSKVDLSKFARHWAFKITGSESRYFRVQFCLPPHFSGSILAWLFLRNFRYGVLDFVVRTFWLIWFNCLIYLDFYTSLLTMHFALYMISIMFLCRLIHQSLVHIQPRSYHKGWGGFSKFNQRIWFYSKFLAYLFSICLQHWIKIC